MEDKNYVLTLVNGTSVLSIRFTVVTSSFEKLLGKITF